MSEQDITKAIDKSAIQAAKTAPEIADKQSSKKIEVIRHDNEEGSIAEQKDSSQDSEDGTSLEQADEQTKQQNALSDVGIDEEVVEKPKDEKSDATDNENKIAEEPIVDYDPMTDVAVDEIIKDESDELLQSEDQKTTQKQNENKLSLKQKIKQFFTAWWENKLARRITLASFLVLIIAAFAVPVSRYFVLNTLGVRSSASIRVLDSSSTQPLKNVAVSIGSQAGITDENGRIAFSNLKLGRQTLGVQRRAFAEVNQPITIGWGSNPLGEYSIIPTGSQYEFVVVDFLSDKPVFKVEAISGEASAFSDEQGLIKLTIDKDDVTDTIQVEIKGDEFRTEQLEFDANTKKTMDIKLAPSRKHVFISKRSGTYDIYKIDADGINEERVLEGTGNERDDLTLISNNSGTNVAYVSTRSGERNSDGFLLSTLHLIKLDGNKLTKIAQSERIQLVGWDDEQLVYVKIAEGASGTNPGRHRLISYSLETGKNKELAASNYFNDVFRVNEYIYYAPASAYQIKPVGLYRVKADGSGLKEINQGETWNILRKSFAELVLSGSGNKWKSYNVVDSNLSELKGPPSDFKSRVYINSPDGKNSLWSEQRDGKGVLLVYGIEKNEDNILKSQSGLAMPAVWLNNSTVVYRVQTPTETADYVVSLDGGEAHKLVDVTATNGIEGWYYY